MMKLWRVKKEGKSVIKLVKGSLILFYTSVIYFTLSFWREKGMPSRKWKWDFWHNFRCLVPVLVVVIFLSSYIDSPHNSYATSKLYAEFRSVLCKKISSKHVEREKTCCEFLLNFFSVTIATFNLPQSHHDF